MRSPFSVVILALMVALAAKAEETRDRLVHRLTGTFSNLTQARSDFSYHTVALHACEIWPQRVDGPWIYLEQSLEDAPGMPYRQQVYQIALHPDGSAAVQVYSVADPVAWTGTWKDPAHLAASGPDGLHLSEACTIPLASQSDGSLKGQTEGCACRSEIHNADYAKTDLTITDSDLVIWDRGFSAKNVQVWGPAHGGFDFKRTE